MPLLIPPTHSSIHSMANLSNSVNHLSQISTRLTTENGPYSIIHHHLLDKNLPPITCDRAPHLLCNGYVGYTIRLCIFRVGYTIRWST
jgi:hypothetical protein